MSGGDDDGGDGGGGGDCGDGGDDDGIEGKIDKHWSSHWVTLSRGCC